MSGPSTTPTWRLDSDEVGLRTLWFDRPGSSQNSLDLATLEALDEMLGRVESDPSATWLIVRSGKPKGFCAGADLRQIGAATSAAEVADLCRRGLAVFDRLSSLKIPTVALIHGTCLGGGLELALACRHRVAVGGGEVEAALGTPEIRLGLIPGWDAISALPRTIEFTTALTMLLTGSPVPADVARVAGLVDSVVPASDLDSGLSRFLAAPASPTRPSWPPPHAAEALADSRRRLSEWPGATRAHHRLLDVVQTDLALGRAAAREAATAGLSELAMTPEARAAIAAIFAR